MTNSKSGNKGLRAIPSIDGVLSHPSLGNDRDENPRFPWTSLVRSVVDDYRYMTKPPPGVDGSDRESVRGWIIREVGRRFEELRTGGQIRVINGTGVILHTNLGRAVLDERTRKAVDEALAHYVSLEVDLESGQRSKRAVTLHRLVALAMGGESALVVNNNAAAVYMVVNSYSPPGRIIVSRGELVEIGGSFRLPEILRHAASEVIEVGTTNRTYPGDYRAVAKPGDILLKVHKSNYAIEGFVSEATCAELTRVASEIGCHMVYDLGSGAVFDYRAAGIGDDDTVVELLNKGVDCVTMSGDKLMGGMQAGLIVGRESFIKKLRQNPLRRAVRVDKVTVAGLQEILRRYLFDDAGIPGVPVLDQVLVDQESIRERARAVADDAAAAAKAKAVYRVDVVDDDAAVGGGSWSSQTIPSAAVRVRCRGEREAVTCARRMRLHSPPIVPRVRGSEIRINMRTVMPYEDADLTGALIEVLAGDASSREALGQQD